MLNDSTKEDSKNAQTGEGEEEEDELEAFMKQNAD